VRIASLVPSITELLFALGLGPQVVARTAFCVHPRAGVRSAKSIGGTKSIRFDKLEALKPTHVVVNIDETPKPLADALAARGYVVVVTHPIAVEDNFPLFRLLGGLFGRAAAAEQLCTDLENALAELDRRAAVAPARDVLYLIWKAPWMTVGPDTYISRMLSRARWRTWPRRPEPRYPVVELDEATLEAVDHVLFASEPFAFTERHVEAFRRAHPAHADKALAVDGQMLSWYGSRAIEGARYLSRLLPGR
jgi:ABC-type Fe3+-hydroxamate transport system substrate-binding protein